MFTAKSGIRNAGLLALTVLTFVGTMLVSPQPVSASPLFTRIEGQVEAGGWVGWRFQPSQGVKYNIHLMPFNADQDLYLYRWSFWWGWQQLAASERGGRKPDGVSFVAEANETLYIWVYGYQAGRFAISGYTGEDTWIPDGQQHYYNQRSLCPDGDNMCSMSCMAMTMASLGRIGGTPQEMQSEVRHIYYDLRLRGPGMATVARTLRDSYGLRSVADTRPISRIWEALKWEIDMGRPVIVNSHGSLTSSGHYILAVGYEDARATGDRRVIVFDPFGRWLGRRDAYDRNERCTLDSARGRFVRYNFWEIMPQAADGLVPAWRSSDIVNPDYEGWAGAQALDEKYSLLAEYDGSEESKARLLALGVDPTAPKKDMPDNVSMEKKAIKFVEPPSFLQGVDKFGTLSIPELPLAADLPR